MAEYGSWLNELSKRTGASVEQSDLDRLNSTDQPDDISRLQGALSSQYERRGASGQTGSGTDSTEMTAQGYGSGRTDTADDSYNPALKKTGGGIAGAGGAVGAWNGGGGGNSNNGALLQQMFDQQRGAAAANRARGDALYGDLSARAAQGLAVDPNDPVIRAQADAFAANQTRSSRDYLGDIAERGGAYANLRGEQRMAAEKAGQNSGTFKAELMGREVAARRASIESALNGMRGMLTAEQQLGLQQQLALLDNSIKQQGLGLEGQQIGNQNTQYYDTLGLNSQKWADEMDQRRSGSWN